MSDLTLSSAELVFVDLARELKVTRAVLERLPEDQYDWKPHANSMSLGSLALHVAFLPEWCAGSLKSDEMDVAFAPRPPRTVAGRAELLEHFDRNVLALNDVVAKFDANTFGATWTMRNGQEIFVAQQRLKVYRVWCINHLIHHRAQLCLYLRLLDVPVPTVYFNTADDPTWVFE